MKQKFFTKQCARYFTLLVLALMSFSSAWGDSYTITFANNASTATSISSSTNATTFIAKNCTTYVESKPASTSSYAYYGDNKTSIRLGKSSNAGSITLSLSETGQVSATSIVVNCYLYNSSKAATLSVNSSASQDIPSTADDLTFTCDGTALSSIKLETSKYAYINSVY